MRETWRFCSWCYSYRRHSLVRSGMLTRNIYECDGCKSKTVKCRVCINMAKFAPKAKEYAVYKWGDEFCAEHSGEIANFETVGEQLRDLIDYDKIFKSRSINFRKFAKIGSGALLFAGIFSGVSYFAAPAVASALGSTGYLGAASTGTAINSLSGAALQSASLAAIGNTVGGGMAGGLGIISAAGAILGGRQGGAIANGYFGEIDGFKLERVSTKNRQSAPSIIFIDGFLSQSPTGSFVEWCDGVESLYVEHKKYGLTWEAKNLALVGTWGAEGASKKAFTKFAAEFAKKASRKSLQKLIPWNWVSTVSDIIGNPWHTSMVKAAMTGVVLADLIARVENRPRFILMGHSLGARVIYYTLAALATKKERFFQDVYRFGGAVGMGDFWKDAGTAVSGKIHNFYSKHDWILEGMYKSANLYQSKPIGLGPIKAGRQFKNYDVSSLIRGHTEYKPKLGALLSKL